MPISKKNLLNLIFLTLIIIMGTAFRIWNLDKGEGLWNDEYMAWWISSFDFGKAFFHKIYLNCHMPLYYFFLKTWCFLFGSSDLSLRISSLLTGIVCILSMYFLGKEYKNEKTGLTAALIAALSGFLIYFSQEVRPYSLIFLISTLISLYFLKAQKTKSTKDIIIYVISNFLLLITHTIGFVFVFFNVIMFSILLYKKSPELRKKITGIYISLLILAIPFVPFVFEILTRDSMSQNWSIFNLSKLFFVFCDYLTPIQTNITSSPLNFLAYLNGQSIIGSAITVFLPFLIAICFIIKGIKTASIELKSLSISAFLTFSVLIITAICGKLILATKYSIEIYPTIILLLTTGITAAQTKHSKLFARIYFIILALVLIFNQNSPQKLNRPEGHKVPAELLSQSNIGQNDYIISLYHQFFRYEKYTKFHPNHLIEIDKASIAYYLMGQGGEKEIKHDGKKALREAFLFKNDKEIIQRFDNIFEQIPQGSKIAIIIPIQVAFFSSNDLKRIALNDEEYKNTQLLFMIFSFVKIQLINSAVKYCNLLDRKDNGPWFVLTFEKK